MAITRFLLSFLVAILAFVGCTTENITDGSDSDIIVANGKTTLKVTIPGTRTYLGEKQGDSYPMYWENDDQLCVNNILSSTITINPNNPSSAEFKFDSELELPYYISYYDNEEAALFGNISYAALFDNEQEESLENSCQPKSAPMYGIVKSAKEGVQLHHLAGVLRFSVKANDNATTLKSITIRPDSGRAIAGLYIINPILVETENISNITLSNGNLTPYDTALGYTNTLNYDHIVYNCNTSKPLSTSESRTFFVTIPEGSHGLCYIELETTSGKKMLCAWDAHDIKGGVVKEFSTITFREGGLENITILKALDSEDAGEQLEFNNIFGYVKDNSGKPIEGVAVSDGFIVTTTDSNGYFEMSPSSDAYYIFISLPAEYEVPINEFGQPTFYQRYPGKQQYDFTLTPLAGGKEKKFAIFAMADPQIWNSLSMTRFRNEAVPGIASHATEVAQSLPCYGITLGDIASTNFSKSGNAEEYREPLRDLFSKSVIGMPVFQVMGNHDAIYAYHAGGVDPKPDRYNSTWQIKMQRGHESVFGPANYSFNRGDVHFIGMRNIEYYMSSDNEYAARLGFLPEQIEWLRQDLVVVPKDKMIVFCAHIPLFSKKLDSVDSVMEILAQFENVHILTGHQHINQNYEHEVTTTKGVKIFEHNVGTVCGSWWDANISMDGTPVGYQVFTCEGNDFSDWYYIGFTEGMNKRSHQMRLYRGDDITGGAKSGTDSYGVKGYYKFNYASDILLANVYNADSAWKVEVYEDGVYSGEMSLIPNNVRPYHDNKPDTASEGIGGNGSFAAPYYSTIADISSDMHFAGLYLGILGKKDRQYNTKSDCYHMYKYTLKNPSAEIMVKATDRFGNVYTETKITKGTDYSITGVAE